MTDKVQAKKDLEFCSAELSKYQNLSRSGLTRDEMLAIDGIMIKLKELVKNLREMLQLTSALMYDREFYNKIMLIYVNDTHYY